MQFVIARHEDGISHAIKCPICDQHMTVQHDPHCIAVRVTHHNAACPWGNEWFRVNPHDGYAEKVTG